MASIKKLLIEGLVFGILVVIIEIIVRKIVKHFLSVKLRTQFFIENKYYAMEITLLFTGILAHFFCEAMGINRWYCKHGSACR